MKFTWEPNQLASSRNTYQIINENAMCLMNFMMQKSKLLNIVPTIMQANTQTPNWVQKVC